MPRVDKSIKETMIPSAIWVLALALAALIGSPYLRDTREPLAASNKSLESRTRQSIRQ
jgi:hypothetical protein